MPKALANFRYMTFDVVGTLIDFESGLTRCLSVIAQEAGKTLDPEQALSFYREARYMPEALRFPDDLARVYLVIAPKLGLPADKALGERLRGSVPDWRAFPDSADALTRLAKRHRLIAMTNAQRWAYDHFARKLGNIFYAAFTTDDTGTEKPDPAFFEQVLAFIAKEGGSRADVLHVAQSLYHDIGISRQLGITNCWIERRHAVKGYGGTIAPERFTEPDYHFISMAELADAVDRSMARDLLERT